MITIIKSNPKFNKVVVSTGDILNISYTLERSSKEELLDGLKLTLECCKEIGAVELNDTNGQVLRASQELREKITENEDSDISICAKIFLNKISSNSIREAMAALLDILKIEQLDSVILAYHCKNDPPTENGNSYDIRKWGSKNENSIADLKRLWEELEHFAKLKQVSELGISDLDIDILSQLHEASSVRPSIVQVNPESSCVVPADLKKFCNKNEIQLLVHSDPEMLLEDEQFPVPDYSVDWIVRYLVHVHSRGVLTAKGYIVGATNKLQQLTAVMTEMHETA